MVWALWIFLQISPLVAAPSETKTVSVSSIARLSVGEVLPSFNGQTMTGQRLSSRDILHQDVPVVITYAATWCEPCRHGLPIIQETVQHGDKARLAIVVLDKEPMKVRKWSSGLGLTSPIIVDRFNAVAKRHGIVQEDTPVEIPVTIVATETGRIVEIFTSEGVDFETRLKQAIASAYNSPTQLDEPVSKPK